MYYTNSQLVKTMFVWFFLDNVLFFTYVSIISMKKNRTRNHPVSNTLLGLSTHCWIFLRFSLSRILELRIIWLIFDVACSRIFRYYFHSRVLIWTSVHPSSIGMECWFNYHMPTSFFPQTYSDNGWSQPAILY